MNFVNQSASRAVIGGAAIISVALTVSAPASAQTIEGDKDITVSLNVVDLVTNSSVTVTQAADLGQIVRPEGARECEYTVFSDGSTDLKAFSNTALPGSPPIRTQVSIEDCAFTSQVSAPGIQLNCPVGETVSFGGAVDLVGIKAVVDLPGVFNTVACEDGDFALNSKVQVTLDSDAPLGAQTITIPFEVTFQ